MAKQSPAQRRASLRNLAKARRARGGRKRRASRAGRHRSSRRTHTMAAKRDGPSMGATYQAGKLGVQIASPLADGALSVIGQGTAADAYNTFISRAKDASYRGSYAKGLISSGIQAYVDRKIGVAGAISRKSVTAIVPELYATVGAAMEQNLEPRGTFANAVYRTSGFDPSSGGFSVGNETKTYLALKYGGFAVRKAASAIPALGDPIKRGLSTFGVAL